ncbi:MAG TPA: hypothetical protein VJN67_09630 [Stellaceae bacterium]|nr:hypothetical protein [Stellaceae bacterium]
MAIICWTKRAVVAATAAWVVLSPVSALAGDVRLRTGNGVAIGSLPSGSLSVGASPGVEVNAGTSANTGLDLNLAAEDRDSAAANFQNNPLTVPDALNRLSIRAGDGKGNVSVIYKFVKTKF